MTAKTNDHTKALDEPAVSRDALRKELRARRKALTTQQQLVASQQIAETIPLLPVFSDSEHIAFYLPFGGEIDPRPLMTLANGLGKSCYLPVINAQQNTMAFFRWTPNCPLEENAFGILEPELNESDEIETKALDLVLTPLVGFDSKARRLGMGGGYYDRCFQFKQGESVAGKPCLVGLAHSCQRVEALITEAWDIPLLGVVTEQGVSATMDDLEYRALVTP